MAHIIPAMVVNNSGSKVKSCEDCPSRNGEICGTLGQPLHLNGSSPEISSYRKEMIAEHCKLYGIVGLDANAARALRPKINPEPVIFPTIANPKEREYPIKFSTSTYSCIGCKNFIPRVAYYHHEFGDRLPSQVSGVCGAKGIAIAASQVKTEAGDCLIYEEGRYLDGPLPVFTPIYADKYLARKVEKSVKSSHLPNDFDPTTYVGPVVASPEDEDMGIRAWVEIVDQKTTNKVNLPIYSRDSFSDSEQMKIPNTSDETMPGDYVDHAGLVFKVAVAWVALDETPCLIGEPGFGKTELLRHIAWIMQLPFERITITASSEVDDLAGKFLFEQGETRFEYGRLSRAWGKPNVICLDEPNTGPNDVLQFIRPLTDNSKQLVLDQNKGEQIMRNMACFLGLAMNPSYDYRNIGANPMADADNSRLLHIEVPAPPHAVEREIIKTRVLTKDDWEIPDPILNSVMNIAKTLRTMSRQGEVPFSWGLRVQIKVARLLRWFDMHDAYMMAMGSSVDQETQDKVLAVVKANVPEKPKPAPKPKPPVAKPPVAKKSTPDPHWVKLSTTDVIDRLDHSSKDGVASTRSKPMHPEEEARRRSILEKLKRGEELTYDDFS